MPRIRYQKYNPRGEAIALINKSNEILEDYEQQGYRLTLRQLYYQLVSRDLIENSQKSYSNLGNIISRARDAGYIDWDHIEDRTRSVRRHPHWQDKDDFLKSVAPQYRHDLWKGQSRKVMVFVEKEALSQVAGRPSERWDVPHFANKGYLSSSSAWNVARNSILLDEDQCESWVVLHLGDHDPSGIDMSRDIEERLELYSCPTESDAKKGREGVTIEVRRIALNMDQIQQYNPPPNPAKQTDSRFESYLKEYGTRSWELDALEPAVIDQLIEGEIRDIVDFKLWKQRKDDQDQIRDKLLDLVEND